MSAITDQIKERIDIIDLIREYVPELKKAGISWKARCPFHQEKTPSFVVSPDKGIWHCFGCSNGGDIFAFIKQAEGLEFPDALRLLAKRAGVKLETVDRHAESERGRILDMIQLAARWYHEALLQAKSAAVAREYIKSRGLDDKTVADWQLGFAPDAWDALLKYLTSRGWREKEIATAGLAVANDRGGYYDRFRYRLLFPITDVHGSVVGFTARKLREEEVGGKYINTPETAVYHKSQILYGLAKAKNSIRQADLAVAVEGNMDCISSHQAGITNVVATSGTALTPEQVRLLKRFTKNIVLAFDPDAAGQAALVRGLEVAWQEDMVVRMANLPKGLDPDALIKKNPEEWQKLIASSQNFMDWLFGKVEKENDLSSALGKKNAGRVLLPWIARLPDAIEYTHYLQLLSAKIHVDENVLRNVLARAHSQARPAKGVPAGAPPALARERPNVLQAVALRLAALIILLPAPDQFLLNFSLDWLASADMISLYKTLDFFYDSDTLDNKTAWLDQLPAELESFGREVVILSDELASGLTPEQKQAEAAVLRARLKSRYLELKLKDIRGRIQSAEAIGSVDEVQRCLDEWQHWSNELHG
ncbi:MAG: DNA primase [Candidatus Komeilibacteria bacterium]|nr:DNA primase [Candidatus Komeilibacteria bacterium]